MSTTEQLPTNEDPLKSISIGMPGSVMPSWDFLSEEDRSDLVYHVRYLKELGFKKRSGEITEDQIRKSLSWETEKQLAGSKIVPFQPAGWSVDSGETWGARLTNKFV